MGGVHKYPTISFRVSPRQREEMEARIMASGLAKKDYFIRSCMNNRVCDRSSAAYLFTADMVSHKERFQSLFRDGFDDSGKE